MSKIRTGFHLCTVEFYALSQQHSQAQHFDTPSQQPRSQIEFKKFSRIPIGQSLRTGVSKTSKEPTQSDPSA